MARHEIRPLDALDRSASVVGTDTLHRQGVSRLRVLSESRFLDMVRRLVEESLSDRLTDMVPATGSAGDAGDEEAPHDRRLRREYQRRWEGLKTSHDSELQQVERRIDRLSRTLRELDGAIREIRGGSDEATAVSDGHDADDVVVDRKTLLREMLLGEVD